MVANSNRALGVAVAAILFSLGSPPASSRENIGRIDSIQPSTQWNIDFGEDNCRLARIFGEGDDRHLVFFEQSGPDNEFAMTLAGPRIDDFRTARFTRLGLERDEEFDETRTRWGSVEGFGTAVIFPRIILDDPAAEDDEEKADSLRGLPKIDLEEAATIDRILFGHGGRALAFETGNMAPAFQALNVCSADFVRVWGLDDKKHEQFKRMARWTNEREISREIQKQYSRAALKRGEQAIIRMRVIVEPDGTVSQCRLFESTRTERLESRACEEMERARFDPALDADGIPMRSFYTTSIIYQITHAGAYG